MNCNNYEWMTVTQQSIIDYYKGLQQLAFFAWKRFGWTIIFVFWSSKLYYLFLDSLFLMLRETFLESKFLKPIKFIKQSYFYIGFPFTFIFKRILFLPKKPLKNCFFKGLA